MKKITEQEFKEYEKVIHKAIKVFKTRYNYKNYDELESMAYEVLMNCLKNYDSSKGCKFTTYLYNNCYLQFFTVLEKENKCSLYKYNNYKNYKKQIIEIKSEDVYNKFNSEEFDIEEQLNIEKIIKIIDTKVAKEFTKVELKKYNQLKKSFEDEQKMVIDKFLMNKIKYILKNRYNITEKDVNF